MMTEMKKVNLLMLMTYENKLILWLIIRMNALLLFVIKNIYHFLLSYYH